MRRLIPGCLASLAAAGLLACSPSESNGQEAAQATTAVADQDSVHPESGLAVVPLTVTSAGDSVHQFNVEIAVAPLEQARGLMFRTQLGPNEGMIFPRSPPDVAGFWMKNTPLPLDIIFIGTDGRIMNIAANTVPYSLESVYADGLTSLVFEIPGGRAEELGIAAGDLVEWQVPDQLPNQAPITPVE